MSKLANHSSAQEIAARGDAIYQRVIKKEVEPAQMGKIVAIDVDTEDFVVADSILAAGERLFKRKPEAEVFYVRVGSRTVHRIG